MERIVGVITDPIPDRIIKTHRPFDTAYGVACLFERKCPDIRMIAIDYLRSIQIFVYSGDSHHNPRTVFNFTPITKISGTVVPVTGIDYFFFWEEPSESMKMYLSLMSAGTMSLRAVSTDFGAYWA